MFLVKISNLLSWYYGIISLSDVICQFYDANVWSRSLWKRKKIKIIVKTCPLGQSLLKNSRHTIWPKQVVLSSWKFYTIRLTLFIQWPVDKRKWKNFKPINDLWSSSDDLFKGVFARWSIWILQVLIDNFLVLVFRQTFMVTCKFVVSFLAIN